MKRVRWFMVLVVALALSMQFTLSQAQEAGPGSGEVVIQADTGGFVPVQGKLTDSSGNPLSGDYSIAVRLYNTASGGTALCSVLETVTISNGLFTLLVPCGRAQIDGQQLYAGIQVGSDAEMTPRLPIYPAPYAFSLRPGAIIANTTSGQNSLKVISNAGGGGGDASLWVENSSTANGIALWSKAAGEDASVVIENAGSGALLKAFGGDGGEDEVQITNQGALQMKADSYLFSPGNDFKAVAGNDLTLAVSEFGSLRVSAAATGEKKIAIGITLPGVLYGQPVKVEEITIFYNTSSSSSCITHTDVFRLRSSGITAGYPTADSLISDATDRLSATYVGYTIVPTANQLLNAEQGILNITLTLNFINTAHYIQIGGVRVRLGHHPLY